MSNSPSVDDKSPAHRDFCRPRRPAGRARRGGGRARAPRGPAGSDGRLDGVVATLQLRMDELAAPSCRARCHAGPGGCPAASRSPSAEISGAPTRPGRGAGAGARGGRGGLRAWRRRCHRADATGRRRRSCAPRSGWRGRRSGAHGVSGPPDDRTGSERSSSPTGTPTRDEAAERELVRPRRASLSRWGDEGGRSGSLVGPPPYTRGSLEENALHRLEEISAQGGGPRSRTLGAFAKRGSSPTSTP